MSLNLFRNLKQTLIDSDKSISFYGRVRDYMSLNSLVNANVSVTFTGYVTFTSI